MGDWFQSVVDRDATEEEAPALGAAVHQWLVGEGIVAAQGRDCVLGVDAGYPPGPHYRRAVSEPYPGLLTFRTNGLEIITRRTIFHAGQGTFELVCATCSGRFVASDDWDAALGDWYEKKGPGI